MEVHCRSHLDRHLQNSLHVPKQSHYPNDHYHAPDLCRASRQGEEMAFRFALEVEDAVLVGLVRFLANLLGELIGLRSRLDHSYKLVPGMFVLV